MIALNPSWFGNPEKFKPRLLASARTNFHPPGTDRVESVITHEFGHQIDNWLQNEYGYAANNPVSTFQHSVHATRQLSGYAITNTKEAWAEGFSSLRYTPEDQWTEYTRELKALLDRIGPDTWRNRP